MDLLKTGNLIKNLRCEAGLTQKALAEKLGISPKTVSKWETGKGFCDVSLLAELSKIFSVDINKLIKGEMPLAKKELSNVKKTRFFVCEKCGNVLTSIQDAKISCCARFLAPLVPKPPDDDHKINIEKIEDDFYITFSHPMTKEHYISFFSYVRFDRTLMIKLYPEQGAEVRFPQMRGGKMYYYCNRDGLFEIKI